MTTCSNRLTRRRFLARTAEAAALTQFPAAVTAHGLQDSPSSAGRPDILFLLADDYTFDLIHALGCAEIQTPNLDRIVERGTSFINCYNQGGWHGAVCVASRTMLMTGLYLWQAQAAEARLEHLSAARRLWPQLLHEAGYRTCMSGKWHVHCDPENVFQDIRNVRPGMPPDIASQYNRPSPGGPDGFDASEPSLGGHYTGGKHWAEVVADDALHFLREAAGREEPHFLYLAFNAPHDPRQAPRACLDLYDPRTLAIPPNFLPEYPSKEGIGCGPYLRDERLAPFPRTETSVRVHRREYFAAITHLDTQVGRVLDALQASGRAERTLVIFTADNGLAAGQHGLMGKQNMFEHSMKVPLLMAGPGVCPGKRLDALVYLQDIVPTTLELVGARVPSEISYRSLVPLLRQTQTTAHDEIYGAYMELQRMIRVGHHKLIFYPRLNQSLLFDLEADPAEMRDLAGSTQHAPTMRVLREALLRIQKALGDPLVFS